MIGEVVPEAEYEFWTSPSAYYYIQEEAPGLLKHLSASSLVIFKGDLKYEPYAYRYPHLMIYFSSYRKSEMFPLV